MNPIYLKRRRSDIVIRALCLAAAIFGVVWLALILFTLFYNGLAGLSFEIFTRNTPPPGSTEGGLLNAIVGSVMMTVIGVGIGAPLGMFAGTHLAEYGKHDKLTPVIRFINDILLSAPSIIIGLFIYGAVVVPMKGFSAIAGALALAVIVIPVVLRTAEDMLRLVPNPLREAASALGLPRSLVIRKIAYGRTSFVTVATTESGVYSSEALTNPHVRYPGIYVDPLRLHVFPSGKLLGWSRLTGWTSIPLLDAHSFGFLDANAPPASQDGVCVSGTEAGGCR